MTTSRTQKILSRLADHPKLLERVEEILNIVENPDDRAILLDDAEELVTQELRLLGKEMLQEWSQSESEKAEYALRNSGITVKKKTKKKSLFTQPTAKL